MTGRSIWAVAADADLRPFTAGTFRVKQFVEKRKEKPRRGPQAWIKETKTELSDSEVLTLPGGFEPVTPKSLAWPRATKLSGQLPFVKSHDLANRLHANIWLLVTYTIPAGMYASQIWATPFSYDKVEGWIRTLMTNLKRVRPVPVVIGRFYVAETFALTLWAYAHASLYNAHNIRL